MMLDFIDGFIKGNGYSPTLREIMRALGYKSVSTVAKHIDNLVSAGLLDKRDGEVRSLAVCSAEKEVWWNNLTREIKKREEKDDEKSRKEVEILRNHIDEEANLVMKELSMVIPYKVGAMLELPRACILADEIAEYCDFFTFGTNDLTQTTLGFSRDDAEGKFLPAYLENKVLSDNPFAVLDEKAVGSLVEMAVSKARSVKSSLSFGICGEHGGEPQSIDFCHRAGLTFVSCSPYRVPIARVAVAQAKLRHIK